MTRRTDAALIAALPAPPRAGPVTDLGIHAASAGGF